MFRSIMFKSIFFAALIAMPLVIRAQAVITTKNASISADVSHDGSGLIDIYRTATSPKAYMTYPRQSFLTILANGVLYTNNPYLPDTSPPAIPLAPVMLTGGVDTLFQTPSGNDTIRTIWSPDSNFDIIQDVYPVLFRTGGQIVIRIQAVNHSNNVLSIQAQYLLDVNIVGTPFSNDNARIATDSGYITNWKTFSQTNTSIVPPCFLAFQNDLGESGFPGNVGCGFLNDSLAEFPLGLMPPSTFTIVDWPTIVQTYSWGWPPDSIGKPYYDEAALIQWPFTTTNTQASNNNVVEIGRTSYGTGGFVECNDNVDAFTFYPYLQHILHFGVTSLIFNTSSSDTLSNAEATLSVDSFFKIVSPKPVLSQGLAQTQPVNPATLLPASMGEVSWIDTLSSTSALDTSTMQLYVSAVVNKIPVTELSRCSPDVLPRRSGDVLPPVIVFLSRDGSYNGSICNARCSYMLTIDSGLEQSGIQSVDATTITNMQLILPKIDTLGRSSVLYSVCVIDSMHNGYANVTVTDQAGNSDSTSFTYCTINDTLAPLIDRTADNRNIALSIQENRPWDRGIQSIRIISDTNLNVTFNPPNNWVGLTSVQALGTPVDTSKPAELCIEVFDIAGNRIDTCFNYIPGAPLGGVAIEEAQPVELTVLPNPSEDRFEIQLTSSAGGIAEGEILDLLGRTVGRFSFNYSDDGSYSYIFDARQLPSGAYFLRVNFGGEVLTKQMIKE